MKTIGFTKSQDKDLIYAEFLDQEKDVESLSISQLERRKIADYLTGSEAFFSITLAVFDQDHYIGPYALHSDGEWIWPTHFSYYLEKLDFSQLTSDFLDHLRNCNFQVARLSEQQRRDIELFMYTSLLVSDEKQRNSIKRNLRDQGYKP